MNSIREEFEKHVKNPHDAAFKVAFRKIEPTRSFFRKYLPRQTVEARYNHRKKNRIFGYCPAR
jgi:hypothetical protein